MSVGTAGPTAPSSGTPAALLADGLISRLDAVASVTERLDFAGTGHGTRVIEVRLQDGLAFEVFPDHGLDIGSAWFGGTPFAWRSAIAGDVRASAGDGARNQPTFLERFRGGLLVTCGLDNIGPATDVHEMHGSHHRKQATEVSWSRALVGNQVEVVIRGAVDSIELFGRRVVLHRTITARTGTASLTIEDTVVNEGRTPAAVPTLYHVNFGAPFLTPGTAISTGSTSVTRREPVAEVPDWATIPDPTDTMIEGVFEHAGYAAGEAMATVSPPNADFSIDVAWDTAALPRLYQWVWPARGGWALGIEPANAPLFGPDRAGEHLGAPVLAPGQRDVRRVTVTAHKHADRATTRVTDSKGAVASD